MANDDILKTFEKALGISLSTSPTKSAMNDALQELQDEATERTKEHAKGLLRSTHEKAKAINKMDEEFKEAEKKYKKARDKAASALAKEMKRINALMEGKTPPVEEGDEPETETEDN